MSLSNILKNPFFLKDREELLNYKLFYEIKKIGLENNVDFELLEPIIDKNGYDLLIKFKNLSKPIQLKCAEREGTNSWKINKFFFRPSSLADGRTIIKDCTASYIGLGGGVIVIEYFVNDDSSVEIKYYYSDFAVLSFFQRSIKQWTLHTNFVDYVANIFDDKKRKFTIPKTLFQEVTIEQMLYLARILPTTNNLRNLDLWTFNYPPLYETTDSQRIVNITKDITILLENGEFSETKINLNEIFDYGLRNYNINGKLTI